MSMLDEGKVAIVPVDTTLDPKNTQSYDVCTMRTAKIKEWYPRHVKVEVYNDQTGKKKTLFCRNQWWRSSKILFMLL